MKWNPLFSPIIAANLKWNKEPQTFPPNFLVAILGVYRKLREEGDDKVISIGSES